MANGTNRKRKQILGLQNKDRSVRMGEGNFQNNLITEKATQTGTARFGGTSTTEFEQRTTINPEITRRFKESPGFFAGEDVTKPSAQLFKERKQKQLAKEVRVKPVGTVRARPTFAQRAKEQGDVQFQDLSKLKRGESIGNITIGRETAAEEAQRKFGVKRKGTSNIFSQQGIRALFGGAADLAKIFASSQFQQRKARGIRSATARKTRAADSKAINEKIKALGDLRSQLIDAGGESDLIGKIDAQLQRIIGGQDQSDTVQKIGVLGKLLKLGPLTKEQEQLFTGE